MQFCAMKFCLISLNSQLSFCGHISAASGVLCVEDFIYTSETGIFSWLLFVFCIFLCWRFRNPAGPFVWARENGECSLGVWKRSEGPRLPQPSFPLRSSDVCGCTQRVLLDQRPSHVLTHHHRRHLWKSSSESCLLSIPGMPHSCVLVTCTSAFKACFKRIYSGRN